MINKIKMGHRSSFSQHKNFDICNLMWYFEKILKITVPQDFKHANAGSCVHDTLEQYFLKNLPKLMDRRKFFEKEWAGYKLEETSLKNDKEVYWMMVVRGVALGVYIDSPEMKIFYDEEIIAYLDGVNTRDDEIHDWKSSKRAYYAGNAMHPHFDALKYLDKETRKTFGKGGNENEYLTQLLLYSWLYHRKFGKLPKKVTVQYLRYEGAKGKLSLKPTITAIEEVGVWYTNILSKMNDFINSRRMPNKCESCFKFCQYKHICFPKQGQFSIHLKGNYLFVKGDIPEIIKTRLDTKFQYDAKDSYFIKQRYFEKLEKVLTEKLDEGKISQASFEKKMSKLKVDLADGTLIDTRTYFLEKNTMRLPIGLLDSVKETLEGYIKWKKLEDTGKIEVIDHRVFNQEQIEMPSTLVSGKTLRYYQSDAVKAALEYKVCMLQLATSAGKSLIMVDIIKQLRYKTLIMVNKIDLMNQIKRDFKDELGLDIGVIGGGKYEPKHITIATVQSINAALKNNPKEMEDFLASIRVWVCDEQQNFNAKSYWAVANQMTNTEYRIGVSGTCRRTDGNDMYLNAGMGEIRYDLSADQLIKEGFIMRPDIKFIDNFLSKDQERAMERNSREGLKEDEEPTYPQVYESYIVNNTERNAVIIDLVRRNKGKKILILVNRTAHGDYFAEKLNVPYLHGKVSSKKRQKLMEDFNSPELDVLVGTLSIFAEGLSVSTLNVVINAAGNKSDIKTIQSLGRLLRKHKDKEIPVFYDFFDSSKMLIKASKSRQDSFKKEGHNVKVIDWASVGQTTLTQVLNKK